MRNLVEGGREKIEKKVCEGLRSVIVVAIGFRFLHLDPWSWHVPQSHCAILGDVPCRNLTRDKPFLQCETRFRETRIIISHEHTYTHTHTHLALEEVSRASVLEKFSRSPVRAKLREKLYPTVVVPFATSSISSAIAPEAINARGAPF